MLRSLTNCAMQYLKVRSYMRGRARAEAGGKLASTQIITCVHTCAVAERRRSGSKIRSARNGSNTQFAASASKPRAPNHHCPQEMAGPPGSAPRMCEHIHGSGAGMSKSARLRSATAPRMCECSFKLHLNCRLKCQFFVNSYSDIMGKFKSSVAIWKPHQVEWQLHLALHSSLPEWVVSR